MAKGKLHYLQTKLSSQYRSAKTVWRLGYNERWGAKRMTSYRIWTSKTRFSLWKHDSTNVRGFVLYSAHRRTWNIKKLILSCEGGCCTELKSLKSSWTIQIYQKIKMSHNGLTDFTNIFCFATILKLFHKEITSLKSEKTDKPRRWIKQWMTRPGSCEIGEPLFYFVLVSKCYVRMHLQHKYILMFQT